MVCSIQASVVEMLPGTLFSHYHQREVELGKCDLRGSSHPYLKFIFHAVPPAETSYEVLVQWKENLYMISNFPSDLLTPSLTAASQVWKLNCKIPTFLMVFLTLIRQQSHHWLLSANCYVMDLGRGLGERERRREGGRGGRERERDFCTACPCYSRVSYSMHVCFSVVVSPGVWMQVSRWFPASASHLATAAAPWQEDAGMLGSHFNSHDLNPLICECRNCLQPGTWFDIDGILVLSMLCIHVTVL